MIDDKNKTNLLGKKNPEWVASLPQLYKEIAQNYGLTHLQPVANLSYHYVLSGFQGDQPIVLKLSDDVDTLKRESLALQAFSRFGGVKVLAEQTGMLLLEQAIPGTSLQSYFPEKEDEAIQITCTCLQQLHQAPIPKHNSFPHIQDWLIALDQKHPIPTQYLHQARQVRDDLLTTTTQTTLLHGDLHHDNILQNGSNWLVIDPKSVIGDPCFDVTAFIRNPIPELLQQHQVIAILQNRITGFAKAFMVSESRILHWCYVQAVLAWIWALEDDCSVDYFKAFTEIMHRMLLSHQITKPYPQL